MQSTELQHVEETLKSGWLAPGKNCTALENELSLLSGQSKGLVVNSRSSAEFLAMICGNIYKGAEVIVSDISIEQLHLNILQTSFQAKIKHLDINKDNINEIFVKLDSLITDETQALILGDFTPYESLVDMMKIRKEYPNLQIISDFPATHKQTPKEMQYSTINVTDISGICSVILFQNEEKYQRAIGIRDWGRVGTQNEDVNERFSKWVLGDGVRYDYKFVFGDLGFNFKSCDIAASLALDEFHRLSQIQC